MSRQGCAEVYVQRMLKLQIKLRETGLFDVLEEFLPQQFIDVGWGGKDTEAVCLFGNTLPIQTCQEKPSVIFESQEKVFYTVIAFDADCRSSSTGCFLYWLRINVTGDIRFASGRDIFRWQTPHPNDDRDHRFFFLVLHQADGPIAETEPIISKNSLENRSNVNIRQLLADRKLQTVIGANCCRLRYDAAVVEPAVAQLRDKIVLDNSGRRILVEEHNGKKIVYGTE